MVTVNEDNKRIYDIMLIYRLLLFNDNGGLSAEGLNMVFDLEDIPYAERMDIINGITTYVNAYKAKKTPRK